jgi:hypothetical protein
MTSTKGRRKTKQVREEVDWGGERAGRTGSER